MSYQVLARKWRPQTFDEVVGQRGVTETLRNAIASGRVAHAFIFAGARGVGKTTTARILAKALNCVSGPTPEPCGTCDACVEIAEGRDIDVVEIDAATHTGVDNVREVIIEGLGVRPVRDRYKIFVIDEVHMLSTSSFNALLKSIEEPPPHVVFMMATTELHKIPDTIRSRSQEYEFRTIGTRAIADQLVKIARAESLEIDGAALQLLARAAEGSLRDAESALDQVMAFAGARITQGDVVTVLGLVGRDLLMDIVECVADEDASRVFGLASRATEAGLDLRLLCRELSRLVRDMMVLSIDPSRAADPELAADGDRARLQALAARFSREDLLRSFDVLSRAEYEIRNAAQPRDHLEMALLRWMHLRKLVPLAEIIESLEGGAALPVVPPSGGGGGRAAGPSRPAPPVADKAGASRRVIEEVSQRRAAAPSNTAAVETPREGAPARVAAPRAAAPAAVPDPGPAPGATTGLSGSALKDAFLEEVKRGHKMFYGTAVAQARRIDVGEGDITFVLTPRHRVLTAQIDQKRAALEAIATRLAGRRVAIRSAEVDEPADAPPNTAADQAKDQLKQRAMADSAVQALLEVLPVEIKDIEEIEN